MADTEKKSPVDVEVRIGERSLSPKNDPAVAHAVLLLASATSDLMVKHQLTEAMLTYMADDDYDYSKLAPSFPRLPKTIGGGLVYVAQSALGDPSPLSAWSRVLSRRLIEVGHACYDQSVTFDEVFNRNGDMGRVFARALDIKIAIHPSIGLPPWVSQPCFKIADELHDALTRLDAGDTTVVRALSSFILLRSRVVVADLNTPSYGGMLQALELANMAGIPIIGVSNRVTISPWVLDVATAIVPADITKIIALLRTWLFT